jgi:hypothetical protein
MRRLATITTLLVICLTLPGLSSSEADAKKLTANGIRAMAKTKNNPHLRDAFYAVDYYANAAFGGPRVAWLKTRSGRCYRLDRFEIACRAVAIFRLRYPAEPFFGWPSHTAYKFFNVSPTVYCFSSRWNKRNCGTNYLAYGELDSEGAEFSNFSERGDPPVSQGFRIMRNFLRGYDAYY